MSTLWTFAVVALVVLGLLFLVGSLADRKQGVKFRPGWMCGVVGLRGGGKSLFVARLIATRLSSGQNVVANFGVPGSVRMESWEDCIMAPPGSTVVLDEAHQWAKSEAGKSPEPMANWYISHGRKLGHEVWWIAQDETQVAGFVRKQTNEMVEASSWPFGLHRAKSYDPREFRKAKAKVLWSWWYSPRGAAIRVYDTMEFVRPVINDRDSAEVKAQKLRLCEMIDELIERREIAAAGGLTVTRGPALEVVNDDAVA